MFFCSNNRETIFEIKYNTLFENNRNGCKTLTVLYKLKNLEF